MRFTGLALIVLTMAGCALTTEQERNPLGRPDLGTKEGSCVRQCISEYRSCSTSQLASVCSKVFNACFETCPDKK